MKILETERLILRTWQEADLQPMFEINQDAKVMQYFPGLQDQAVTKKFIAKVKKHFEDYGYSLYACIKKDNHQFIGSVGLLRADFKAHFTPATEIGWRLSSKHWNQGYATEAARAVLHYAFNSLEIDEIVSFTAVNNMPSRRVMEKIGLHYDPAGDFDHPNLAADSPLLKHVLYRLFKQEYLAKHTG